MDGALVDVGSHHPKKGNDNHYVGLCVEYRIEVLFLFSFFFCWSKQGHGFLNFVM
jgi:hypothetical protein